MLVMNNKPENIQKESIIEYGLMSIEILKFSLNETENVDISIDKIGFELNLSGDFDETSSHIEVITDINIFKEKDKGRKRVAELKTKFVFFIKGADSLKEDGNETYLPKKLIDSLNLISVSTTRGILFTKFQGTKIQNIILPLISPKDLSLDLKINSKIIKKKKKA